MEIRHSLVSDGTYLLHSGEMNVGTVRKTFDGFYAELVIGDFFEGPTMKSVKEWVSLIAKRLPQYFTELKPLRISVEEVRSSMALSHTRCQSYIEEIYRFHPYIFRHQMGAAFQVLVYRDRARVGDKSAEWWLKENFSILPKMRHPDWEAYESTGLVSYLD